MRNGLLAAAVIAASAALTGVASAAPGDLDPSFGGTGKVLFPPGVEQDKANDMLIQPDGKIVLVGSAIVSMGANGRSDYAIRRLNPNGSPDTGFGTGGLALVDFNVDDKTPANSASAVALQPDGKIIVVGSTGKSTGTLASAARLNKDGSLDNTFGPGGDEGSGRVVLIQQQEATDVAVDSSGRILVAGPWSNSALFQTGPDFSVISLNGDGSVDSGFNGGSANPVRVSFGAGPDAPVRIVVQPDGRIVLAGFTVSGDSDAAVTRVVPGTGVDAGFGTGGKQTYGFGAGSEDSAEDVLVEPGGKIDVAGFGTGSDNFTLTRLTAAGQLDNSLNGTHTVDVDFGGVDSADAIALQSNGKVLLAGDNGHDLAVTRIQPGGALDSTFGAGGKTTLALGDFAQGNAMALQADGRIVVAGTVGDDMYVVRLQGDSAAAGGAPTPGGGSGPNGSSKVPRCAGHRATIVGTSHRDKLKGTRRADVIVALGGSDTVDGGGGNDIICGGAGNDSVKGGSGSDKIYGEAGKDKLSGGAGNDKMSGGAGNDALSGGAGKDEDNGGSGKDSCAGKDSEKSC
jgi:uncharacterized delta-60 repeat protein